MRSKIMANFNKNVALLIWLGHLGVAAYFYSKRTEYETYYWGAIFILIASLPYLIARIKNTFIAYEAIYLYLAGFIINYASNMFLSTPILPYMDIDSWTYVMQLVFAGAIAFLIGYWSKLGRIFSNKLPLKNFLIAKEKLLKLPVKLYLLGYISRLIFTTSFLNPEFAKFQGWQILNVLIKNSILTALMVDVYFYFSPRDPALRIKNKKKYLFRFLIFLIIEIIFGFFTGMRENLFMPIVLIFIAYMKATKKIPYLAMGVFAILFISFVMPFTSAFREQYWHGTSFNESLQDAFEKVSHKERLERVEESTSRISNSLLMAVYCTEKKKMGDIVKTYENLNDYIIRFIPRFLWPGKPTIDYNRVGKDLGLIAENDYGTSIGLTLIAAFILNNGALGVIFGMFLVGIIIRVYWNWLMVRSAENFLAFIIYFNLLYTWLRDEELYIILHSNLAFLFYTYFLLGLINKRKPSYR